MRCQERECTLTMKNMDETALSVPRQDIAHNIGTIEKKRRRPLSTCTHRHGSCVNVREGVGRQMQDVGVQTHQMQHDTQQVSTSARKRSLPLRVLMVSARPQTRSHSIPKVKMTHIQSKRRLLRIQKTLLQLPSAAEIAQHEVAYLKFKYASGPNDQLLLLLNWRSPGFNRCDVSGECWRSHFQSQTDR